MRVNPEQLVTFSVVAQLGSVSRAAQALNLSQPAVSGQLRALQDQIGRPLYVRRGRGVTLTEDGERLLPHAQAIARTLHEVGEQITDLRRRPLTPLRVGFSFALTGLASAAARRALDLGLHLQADTRPAADLAQDVRDGTLAAALLVTSPQRTLPDLDLHRVGEDQLRLAVAPDHPLARQGYVAPHALRGETLLWPARGSGVRLQTERILQGVVPAHGLEVGSLWAALEGVRRGDGVAVLPASFMTRDVQDGHVRSLGLEAPSVTVLHVLVTPPAALLPAATLCLIELFGTLR